MASNRKASAALSLRLAGATYEEVAETLGFADAAAALAAVERLLASQVNDESKEQMRQIASHRYERLLRGVWLKATDAKDPEQLSAVRTARELIERHVALQGLAVPQQIVVRTPTTAELEQWVAEVSKIAMPDVIEADVLDEPLEIEGEVHPKYNTA